MNRLLYFANAFACTVNVGLWFAIDGKFAMLVTIVAAIAAAWSLVVAFRTRDPYYYNRG